ncbi:MAG: hypothetical protein H0V40_06840 [Actinobacteria bacterium]|nr:hypothetical protein [Actinomycetota bacterium]
MPELERSLRELGGELAYPDVPDLAAAVAARLEAEPPRRTLSHSRRRLALALVALVALALAGALAVPAARTAILELLGLEGATIERVDRLPAVSPPGNLALGRIVSLAEARRLAGFRLLVPARPGYGEPDEVRLSDVVPGGLVSLLYGRKDAVRLLVTEFVGLSEPALIRKTLGPGTAVEPVRVRSGRGYWIQGRVHVVLFRDASGEVRDDTSRLAANVLLLQRGRLLVRLEGKLSRAEAVAIAESLR